MSGYGSERCPSIERYTEASGCHMPIVRETEPTAPEDSLLFLHCLDVLPPYGGGRFTQSERPLRQLQIVCRKPHQMFGHARLSTLLCESYAPLGQLAMVFGSQHSRTMTAATGSLNLNPEKRFKFD